MNPERWQQIKSIFNEALEIENGARAAFLDQACGTDAELRGEVESLLTADVEGASGLDEPLLRGADPLIGRCFGAYRVLRRLGSGGMGAVYLAARADDQFKRLVAVKAIRPELLDDHMRRRFENERHTLAALEHPNIVKLLDGGTEDGAPYLVMDYVEGQPIDRFVKERGLSVRERLELFRTLCGAVHYAHQNLVIHRDLKPANILVTPQGVPKLLDFGIAKLIRAAYAAATVGYTRTEAQPMTPEYASPEQILGQPITTASDIYSLGVLLYVLLCDAHPFAIESQSQYQLEHSICEGKTRKPSEVAEAVASRQIRGDLDVITATAMRKEPQRRYPSAEHLAEDIRRYLEGLPVAARGDTLLYRARKFVARHKAPVIAGSAAAVLLIGLGIEDHINRLRAERRFQDLRSFANFAIQDLDKAMREGLTPARQVLLERAVTYLDGLALEAKGDRAIQLETVAGYLKVADIQGNLFVANVGDAAQAQQSVAKALTIAEGLAKQDAADPKIRAALASCHEKLGDLLGPSGDRAGALDHYRQALERATDPLPKFRIQSKKAQIESDAFDPQSALESYRGCERAGRDMLAKNPADPVARNALAFARERIAWFAMLSGEPAGAEETVRGAIAAYESSNPTPRSKRNLAMALETLAEVQKRSGKTGEALATCRRSLELSQALLAADPQNTQFGIDLIQERVLLIELLHARGEFAAARLETATLLELMDPLVHAAQPSLYHLASYITLITATPFAEFWHPAEVVSLAKGAVEMTHEKDCETLDLLARAYERAGYPAEAIAAERKAIALLPKLQPGRPVPEMRGRLERTLAALDASQQQQAEGAKSTQNR